MALVEQALRVAEKYPVFPTNDKMPAWSNKELGVAKGFGGYKIATQDPEEVTRLFSHPRAKEIAVPMGEMSLLLCVDVDLYKHPDLEQWVKDNEKYLDKTLTHSTRSGGLHIFFKHPGDNIRFPATLRVGVDMKAAGNGYVCFPPTEGYTALNKLKPRSFPMDLLKEAMQAKGGTGSTTQATGTFNTSTDEELIDAIQSADDLYPALRTLSYRLPIKGMGAKDFLDTYQQVTVLRDIMKTSVAAQPGHPRHEDWKDRYDKIGDLVESANEKHDRPEMDPEAAKLLAETKSFVDTQKMIAAGSRPIGPQRETTPEDIEERVAALNEQLEAELDLELQPHFETMSAKSLRDETLPPIEWVVPHVIPKQGTVSIGGTSNVGKTRFLAAFAVLGASGDLPLLGLPGAPPFSSLWLANEERVDDIKRRIKATVLQHGLKQSRDISVRGKDAGMLRLVAVNESGNPEIEEDNVALLVAEARRIQAAVIYFDPYVTLSDLMDENSATSAAVLTKAFILIASLTGAAVIHVHHTPKDRSADMDWYRGDSGAWRGSGAIYSALDCGYTLSHWMPKGKDNRKAWKENYIDQQLSRWIVLDTGKIREGKPLDPVIYELVGQDMEPGEGWQIGVCRLAEEHEANNCLIDAAVDVVAADEIARALYNTMGPGSYAPQQAHKKMKGHQHWSYPSDKLQARSIDALYVLLEDPIVIDGHDVQLVFNEHKPTKGRWTFVIQLAQSDTDEVSE
jgi:hypothetical protein